MTLDEILKEAERLEEAAKRSALRVDAFQTEKRCDAFYAEHGPRLARVARAAVEMREGFDTFVTNMDERIAALDSAVREVE